MGFEQITVASDYERQLDVEWFKDLNLLLEEKDAAAGEEDDATEELMLSQEAWNTKKAKMLK